MGTASTTLDTFIDSPAEGDLSEVVRHGRYSYRKVSSDAAPLLDWQTGHDQYRHSMTIEGWKVQLSHVPMEYGQHSRPDHWCLFVRPPNGSSLDEKVIRFLGFPRDMTETYSQAELILRAVFALWGTRAFGIMFR